MDKDRIEKLGYISCIERNTYLNQEGEDDQINADDYADPYNWQGSQKYETSHQTVYANNRIHWTDAHNRTSLESEHFSENFRSTGLNGTESRHPTPYQHTCKHKQTNVCFLCTRVYARPSTLKTHLRTHSGLRPYSCMHCHKKFSQAANLTAHLRTHSGERPFQCPVCFRCFSQSSSVTTHLRTHSGEKPYTCRVCSKAFADSSTLTKHARVHSGEKPYKCSLCDVRFSQSGNLKRHRRLHMAKEQSVYM
ncbi:glass [Paragonimus westermani]|uniref:Glass n=1 Tax=Paragonimus westermani TaxID=34504 RepID=A0A5J4N471_9TREM|nr:glass [Paragonimus westermani]